MADSKNSLRTDDTGFVGVSPEYKNAAYDQSKPLVSKDKEQAKIEKAASSDERERAEAASRVGHRGFESNTPHPSDHRGPAEDYIEANRAFMSAVTGTSDESGEEEGAETPPTTRSGLGQ